VRDEARVGEKVPAALDVGRRGAGREEVANEEGVGRLQGSVAGCFEDVEVLEGEGGVGRGDGGEEVVVRRNGEWDPVCSRKERSVSIRKGQRVLGNPHLRFFAWIESAIASRGFCLSP
jgi:hypothetical protein